MHYKQVANRRKEKWQTGGRDKCLSAAEPSEVLKVWLIRIPRFCVDGSNSVPNLPLPMKNIGKKTPGSSIHKLYGLRSPNSQPSELGNLTNHNHMWTPSSSTMYWSHMQRRGEEGTEKRDQKYPVMAKAFSCKEKTENWFVDVVRSWLTFSNVRTFSFSYLM